MATPNPDLSRVQPQNQAQEQTQNQPSGAMHPLRSQGEFYMTGVTPVDTNAEPNPAITECTICLEPLTEDVVKINACGHVFHTVCILGWFEKNAPRRGSKHGSCPNCRCELYEPDPRPAPVQSSGGEQEQIRGLATTLGQVLERVHEQVDARADAVAAHEAVQAEALNLNDEIRDVVQRLVRLNRMERLVGSGRELASRAHDARRQEAPVPNAQQPTSSAAAAPSRRRLIVTRSRLQRDQDMPTEPVAEPDLDIEQSLLLLPPDATGSASNAPAQNGSGPGDGAA